MYGRVWLDPQARHLITINNENPVNPPILPGQSHIRVYSLDTCQLTDSVLVSDDYIHVQRYPQLYDLYNHTNGLLDAFYNQETGIIAITKLVDVMLT
jgi:hypothetical protein